MRVLHVLNYGYPYIDGYTVRSMGIVTSQRRYLGVETFTVTSPFKPLTKARDENFVLDGWGREAQLSLTNQPDLPRDWERPSLGLAPATSKLFRRELAAIVEGIDPDIIHAHHPHYVGSASLEIARLKNIPFVYEIRCFNGDYDLDARNPYFLARGKYQNRLELNLCRRADAVVTIADGLADRIINRGIAADRVFIIRNSVNDDVFSPNGGTSSAEKELVVGYATTFEAIEGLDYFVQSVPLARDKIAARGRRLRVRLAGTGRDWDRIRHLVTTLGLADTVQLEGFIPYGEMPDFYKKLDLFVVPRRPAAATVGTTPLKPLEALAMKCPLLVSDLPALRELLEGREGVKFYDPSPECLAERLLAFVENPWSAEQSSVADRTWRTEVIAYEKVYEAAQRNFRRAINTGGRNS